MLSEDGSEVVGWASEISSSMVTLKTKVLEWRVFQNRLSTKDNHLFV